jgi:hypothetical protein
MFYVIFVPSVIFVISVLFVIFVPYAISVISLPLKDDLCTRVQRPNQTKR